MAVTHTDMESLLRTAGCRMIHRIKKVDEYMFPNTKEAFYVNRENQQPQIVIRPAFQVFSQTLSSLAGVITKDPYYHNADMTRFPKRLHQGREEVHYGLAYEFENGASVTEFVKQLSEIARNR